jgi:hypothetical protein
MRCINIPFNFGFTKTKTKPNNTNTNTNTRVSLALASKIKDLSLLYGLRPTAYVTRVYWEVYVETKEVIKIMRINKGQRHETKENVG